jgi:hypothetical protein
MSHKFLNRLALFAYLLVFPAVGLLVACIGFCDPDTCWHLALGKWIFEHRALPNVDPFSSNISHFVFVSKNAPLIEHEWLSDVFSYCIYLVTGNVGLLVSTGLLSVLSLVVIPAGLMVRNRVPRVVALAFVILITCASAFRLWVRPEEISFLLMAALILVNDLLEHASKRRALIFLTAIFSIMVIWSNCHGLFVIGITYLSTYYVLTLLQSLAMGKQKYDVARAGLAIGVAFLGTLINPWGVNLWVYMYRLLISSDPYSNKENGPITLLDLHNPTFVPLVAALVLYWGILLLRLRKNQASLSGQFLSLALATGATLGITLYRRLTPLALLVVASALSKAFQNDHPLEASNRASSTWPEMEPYLKEYGVPGGWNSTLIGLILCGLSAFVAASYLVQPRLPSASRLFHPPYNAVLYLKAHRPEGRMLNDSKFGSMMTWDMKNPPDIFIDGRFDSYDRNLIEDYNKMRLCKNGWQTLIDKYKIHCVFFAPETPIVIQLSKTPGWTSCYGDSDAVVLARTPSVIDTSSKSD